MGYTIGEDSGSGDVDVVCVALVTDSKNVITYHAYSDVFEEENALETIVSNINSIIQKWG